MHEPGLLDEELARGERDSNTVALRVDFVGVGRLLQEGDDGFECREVRNLDFSGLGEIGSESDHNILTRVLYLLREVLSRKM